MISGLLVLIVMMIFQLAFALHVRITLIDCAGEGARAAALIGSDLEVGTAKTRALITSALHADYAANIKTSLIEKDGIELIEVTVQAPLPIVGFMGPDSGISVAGHAVAEGNL